MDDFGLLKLLGVHVFSYIENVNSPEIFRKSQLASSLLASNNVAKVFIIFFSNFLMSVLILSVTKLLYLCNSEEGRIF